MIITCYYYGLSFMGRARAGPMYVGRGAVRARGRGGRPPRAPQRGPSTRGGAGPGPGPGTSEGIDNQSNIITL